MLKSTSFSNNKIDIANYYRLETFLKQNSKKYVHKKSKILTRENVLNFFKDTLNDTFLLEKVLIG